MRIAKRLNMNDKQKANMDDFEAQKKLRAELEKSQQLTGEIVTADDSKK